MTPPSRQRRPSPREPTRGITGITVAGYKSIRDEQSIEIGPLTILAGANCSGKSSMLQPLLLLKQTLEATYDPGPVLLNGPNLRFSEAEQLLSRTHKGGPVREFHVGIQLGPQSRITIHFKKLANSGFEIRQVWIIAEDYELHLTPSMTRDEIRSQIPADIRDHIEKVVGAANRQAYWALERDRCFLHPAFMVKGPKDSLRYAPIVPQPLYEAQRSVEHIIHLPALRGNPRRTYPVTAVGRTFSGTFDSYVATIIAKWQADRGHEALKGVRNDLRVLGLSWKIAARPISDAEVELQVGRLPRPVRGGARDVVSIADVGFGVSQALPVVVALHVGTADHLVYLEQPEIHLHPRAQVALAEVLARAVTRGVRIVVETHSALLLLAIQALVADGKLSPEVVKLHWFTRSEKDGATEIQSADLDQAGAYGDWPEDFGDVEMVIEKRYLDAAEAKMSRK